MSDIANVLAALERIERKLDRLLAPKRGHRTDALSAEDRVVLEHLLPALSAGFGDLTWSVADALDQPAIAADIAKRLGPTPGRSTGRLLKRAATAEPVAGLQVQRIGDSRDGGVWKVTPTARVSATEKTRETHLPTGNAPGT